jgi:hypothetical protein
MIVNVLVVFVDQGGSVVRSHECGWMRLSLARALCLRRVVRWDDGLGR